MTEHTPTPWKKDEEYNTRPPMTSPFRVIANGSTSDRVRPICRMELQGEEAQANAEFIVKACNCHEELLEVLKEIKTQIICGGTEQYQGTGWFERLEQAIAKAEEAK
jgi:hypothetical protein